MILARRTFAALIAGIAGVNGRAAAHQAVGAGGAAVVGQRTEAGRERFNVAGVTLQEEAEAAGVVADQVVVEIVG